MVRQALAIPTAATVLDACEFFIQHRFLAYPVVDENRKLVGVVDVELYTNELDNLGNAEARNLFDKAIGPAGKRHGYMDVKSGEQRQIFSSALCMLQRAICNKLPDVVRV